MYKRPYFDAGLFIAWIQGEEKNGINRSEIIDHLFKMARENVFQIYTSTLSLAEVHKTKNSPRANGEDDEYIIGMLENEYFIMIDLDRNLGEDANRLCRRYNLNPCDAIHLASAERANCDVLLTWDGDLLKVVHPTIKIIEPTKIGQSALDFKEML